MQEVLDDHRSDGQALESPPLQFKLISAGILLGLCISRFYKLLKGALEAIGFKLEVFGLLSRFLSEALAVFLVLLLVVLVFKKLRKGLTSGNYTVNRFFVHAVILYLLTLVLQITSPLLFMSAADYYKDYRMSVEQIGEFELVASIMSFVGYLFLMIGSVIYINKIGRGKQNVP